VYCGTEHRDRTSEILAAATRHPSYVPAQIEKDRPSGHIGEEAARIPMTEEAVLQLVRRHFSEMESVFVCPHVPPKKEQVARRAHAFDLPARERILALYDPTLLGTGEEGFVVTARRLCWRTQGQAARSIKWREFDPDSLYVDDGRLFFGEDVIGIAIAEDGLLDACADAFHVLALSGLPPHPIASTPVRSRGALSDTREIEAMPMLATAPPAHTTSYHAYASHAETQAPDRSCWHCQTPLYEKTPQCAYCGAFPKKKGWLRTA
jgi:hypothetical protein